MNDSARTQPQAYARRLMLQPVSDWERGLAPDARGADPTAFAEAVEFLMRQSPLPALSRDSGEPWAAGVLIQHRLEPRLEPGLRLGQAAVQ